MFELHSSLYVAHFSVEPYTKYHQMHADVVQEHYIAMSILHDGMCALEESTIIIIIIRAAPPMPFVCAQLVSSR